jgi:protein-S-isoprenylcysteine O-methyltransferase Ste14
VGGLFRRGGLNVGVKHLVGSGDRIAVVTLPFVVVGIGLELANPGLFAIAAPTALRWLAVVVLALGIAIWAWSVLLILENVPRHRLIAGGPYAWVRHPLYVSVALLVLPWAGLLFDTWLGVIFGCALYLASRRFARHEDEELSQTFGAAWAEYSRSVRLSWL